MVSLSARPFSASGRGGRTEWHALCGRYVTVRPGRLAKARHGSRSSFVLTIDVGRLGSREFRVSLWGSIDVGYIFHVGSNKIIFLSKSFTLNLGFLTEIAVGRMLKLIFRCLNFKGFYLKVHHRWRYEALCYKTWRLYCFRLRRRQSAGRNITRTETCEAACQVMFVRFFFLLSDCKVFYRIVWFKQLLRIFLSVTI